VCFEGLVLNVTHQGASVVAERLASGNGIPDAVIHMGLENSTRGLKIEVVGANLLANASDDSSKSAAAAAAAVLPIVPGGPPVLPTTADMSRFSLPALWERVPDATIANLHRSSGEAQPLEIFSRDAGGFICNEALYRTLYCIRRAHRVLNQRKRLLAAGFVHLPNAEFVSVKEDAQLVTLIAEQLVEPLFF
jgi:pyrrolidone-carboxylate peptidase